LRVVVSKFDGYWLKIGIIEMIGCFRASGGKMKNFKTED